jgi:hypothetical protein
MLGRRGRSDAPQPPSPRPDLGPARSSRPAVRISRMRPPSSADGRITAFNTPSIPQRDVPQSPANSDRPPVFRTRSLSTPTPYQPSQDGPPASAHSPAFDSPLEVNRDARGQPHITVMSPSAEFHPHPLNTVPIPPSGDRGDMLAATTGFEQQDHSSNNNRWSWLLPSIVRKKSRDPDAESSRARLEGSILSHDYASSEDRAPHSHQYAEDVVDWLDVIGESFDVCTVCACSRFCPCRTSCRCDARRQRVFYLWRLTARLRRWLTAPPRTHYSPEAPCRPALRAGCIVSTPYHSA